MSDSERTDAVPVLVIGAGQAGLAAAWQLRRAGVPYRIVDAAARVGDSWRARYDGLTLFTPRFLSALPGLPLAGDPEGYAGRDEFAAYLEEYARRFAIPVETGTRVGRLERAADGTFVAHTANGGAIRASSVIIASGAFQQPAIPALAGGFDAAVAQLPAAAYRNAGSVPEGTVLVVGDGASGRDIAADLSASRRVLLAAGKPRKLFSERVLGRSMWWWLAKLRLLRVPTGSALGRLMRRTDPLPDRDRNLDSLRRRGVIVTTRLTGASGRTASFADGREEAVDAVVWTAGYRDDASWVDIEGAADASGAFVHEAGVSPVPGLFFVGRPWQRNRASGLIMGVADDAAWIVARIARAAENTRDRRR